MNILVCIKQVPYAQEVKIDPDTFELKDGAEYVVNPFDTYALETAVRIKDNAPETKIVVLTMGPDRSEQAVRDCCAVGADKGYLITDPVFEKSDTLATGRILAKAIAKVEEEEGKFDVIFFGNQATDGDTAQVGPQVAEILGYPQVTFAVDAADGGDLMKVTQENDAGFTVIGVGKPCVIAVTQTSFEPRFPTIKSKMAARKAKVPHLSAADIQIDPAQVGEAGSAARLVERFLPPQREAGMMISEGSVEASVLKLANLLSDAAVI